MQKIYLDESSQRYVLTEEYVKQETGIDLGASLNSFGDANPADLPKRFLKRVSMIVYNFIESRTYNDRGSINAYINAFERKRNAFTEALANQVLYMVNVGDLGLQSGVNLKDGRAMHLNELRGVVRMSADAIDCLTNAGFLYAGNGCGGAI